MVYDILDYYNIKSNEEIIELLSSKYIRENLVEALEEIEYLEENGILYTEDNNLSNINYNQDNIVKAMCLHVAHDCNLKCEYCFASQGNFKGERSMMDLETGKKALLYLAQNSGNRRNLEVDFFGGEPLMNFGTVKDLVDYGRSIEQEYNKHFRFTITTNGVLLDDDKIQYINENMDNVVLSLDGRKTVNDAMRLTVGGEGSYDVILPKIKKMVQARGEKDYYVRGTFTSKNLDFGKDAINFHREGFKKISIEPVVAPEEMDYAIREDH